MFKRIADGTFSRIVAAVCGTIIVVIFYATIPYSKGYQAADQRHQSNYSQNAADYESRQKCERLATVKSAVACYDHASKTTRKEHRAEQDLDAQREMANWAEGMLWATLATFIVTSIGMFLIWLTLSEAQKTTQAAIVAAAQAEMQVQASREANNISRQVADAQMRPYLEVGNLKINKVSKEGAIDIKVRGQTPIDHLKVHFAVTEDNDTRQPMYGFFPCLNVNRLFSSDEWKPQKMRIFGMEGMFLPESDLFSYKLHHFKFIFICSDKLSRSQPRQEFPRYGSESRVLEIQFGRHAEAGGEFFVFPIVWAQEWNEYDAQSYCEAAKKFASNRPMPLPQEEIPILQSIR